MAADLVLVVPEADVDRVEWAKQLVGNAVRSPHTRPSLRVCTRTVLSLGGGPLHLAPVGARLRDLARGNEVLAIDHQPTLGGDPQTGDRSPALWVRGQRDGAGDYHDSRVSQKGRRLGRWLAWEEARTLLQAPNPHSIRGMRDRALLAVLVTCALRRGELSRMNCEHLAMRDGRWVFLDFKGKGNKTRSVAVPLWVKQEIDGWLDVAGIEKGPIFRRVLANGRVGKDALTERAVWQLVCEYAAQIGIGELAPLICGARRRSSAD